MFGRGISRSGSILDIGVDMGLLSKSGAYFSYGDTRLGQGRENARTFLEEHEEVMDEIEGRIRQAGAETPVLNVVPEEVEDEA